MADRQERDVFSDQLKGEDDDSTILFFKDLLH